MLLAIYDFMQATADIPSQQGLCNDDNGALCWTTPLFQISCEQHKKHSNTFKSAAITRYSFRLCRDQLRKVMPERLLTYG